MTGSNHIGQNLLRPNNASVQLPPVQAGASTGVVGGGVTQNNDPLAGLKQYMTNLSGGSTGTAGVGGGISWDSYNKGITLDAGMQEILNGSGPDQDSIAYQAATVAQPVAIFLNQIVTNHGQFSEVFRATVDGFRRNEAGNPCPVREAFVNIFNKHREFIKPVGVSAAPLFGMRLIGIKQQTRAESLTPNQYFQAAELAIRSILLMEMVSWLCKTQEGVIHARQLPRDLAEKMPNLGKFIQTIDDACRVFGGNNAYANLKFELPSSVRDDLNANRYENIATHMYGEGVYSPTVVADKEDIHSLQAMISRNARMFRNEYVPQNEPNGSFTSERGHVAWDTVRNDLDNLTQKNRDEFNLRRFFHNIGKPNVYLIPETDWKAIQKAFPKHPEMGKELTLLPHCFRIVTMDLDNPNGWFSTLVRSERFDMATLLTDPSKLLPLLEETDGGMMAVKTTAIAEVAGQDLSVPDEMCRKLEEKDVIPAIIVSDLVLTNSSKELEATVELINKRASGRFKTVNATSFNTKIWDTFHCSVATDKKTLFQDLPFLFKDSDMQSRPSLKQALVVLSRHFRQGILDGELMTFIDTYLTETFNNYLVNAAGYDFDANLPDHLSVSSLIKDHLDLDHWLEQNNPSLHELFTQPGDDHYFGVMIQLFNYKPMTEGKDQKELSPLELLKYEQELVMERPIHVVCVNQRSGPLYKDSNVPIIVKRSIFPEYFDLIEKSFDETFKEAAFDTTDKIIQFTGDDNLWLFTYSELDKNMATLRHISRRKPLVLMAQD